MKILVCIKAVRDFETTGSSAPVRMNRFDEFALEEALQIRKIGGRGIVEAVSAGPKETEHVLTRAVGLGADRGIHILTDTRDFSDPFLTACSTASLIAGYAQNKKYDLILGGVMSEDSMQGQVGPMLAEMLSLPCLTAVISTRISSDMQQIYVEREIEGGRREAWEIRVPALLTIQSGINIPKYPTLSRMLRAASQRPEIIPSHTLAPKPVRQTVSSAEIPRKQRTGLVLTGSTAQKAESLIQIFRERGFLK